MCTILNKRICIVWKMRNLKFHFWLIESWLRPKIRTKSMEAFLMSTKRKGIIVPKYLKMMIVEEAKIQVAVFCSEREVFLFDGKSAGERCKRRTDPSFSSIQKESSNSLTKDSG